MFRLSKCKWLFIGLLLFTIILFTNTIRHSRLSSGLLHRSTSSGGTLEDAVDTEERRIQCGLAVCTACQIVQDGEKKDLLDSYANPAIYASLHKTFPPPITKELETLPTSGINRIETIIHQSWKTNEVPIHFENFIQSFIKNHASWEYMFWTDNSMRKFIKDHYPNILSLYDSYPHPLNRPDAVRYMILFHFGGVYSDLDVQSLHPLDPMIKEIYLFYSTRTQATNAFMACRKRHPFMKSVIENLFHFYYFSDVLDSTGPRFLTFTLRQYLNKNVNLDASDDDYVYLAPPEYFQPSFHPDMINKLKLLCGGFPCLSVLRQWQCNQWNQEGLRSKPYSFSFTNHVWAHTVFNTKNILNMISIKIYNIVPNATEYFINT
ncbi:hypothetical protein ACJMK2_012483 [Sinanodonta woodiana]|uniref:Uncharacterized protein n=1 Tax=Sinanodonta woodiana TaxID=1069815 RepID=A0ABD3VAB9_SINWO